MIFHQERAQLGVLAFGGAQPLFSHIYTHFKMSSSLVMMLHILKLAPPFDNKAGAIFVLSFYDIEAGSVILRLDFLRCMSCKEQLYAHSPTNLKGYGDDIPFLAPCLIDRYDPNDGGEKCSDNSYLFAGERLVDAGRHTRYIISLWCQTFRLDKC